MFSSSGLLPQVDEGPLRNLDFRKLSSGFFGWSHRKVDPVHGVLFGERERKFLGRVRTK